MSVAPLPLQESAAEASARPLLSMQDASLGYAGHAVLSGVNLDIHAGQFWCLLGPNGEGKTTLIKAMLGALRPQQGGVYRQPALFNAGKVSYVPQRIDLNPVLPMSVREFVLTGLAGVSADATKRRSRLERVLSLVGLTPLERRNYWTLSGGQKQRALVARALIRDPQLLIVDEPTAGLDFAAADAVLRVMKDLYTRFNVTVVFVTHDLHIAAEHATHLAFFRRGKVTAGTKQDVYTAELLQQTFGMQPSVASARVSAEALNDATREISA